MLRSSRSAFARFCVRRAAACQRSAPGRADRWLRLACALTPRFAEPHQALVHLRRTTEDRWGAVAAARDAVERFPTSADAWLLLGDAYHMVFRQPEALAAYEQALVLEERPDAAMAAGEIYSRAGRHADAASRFARAYAAGGGADALWRNAQALFRAGDESASEDALNLWATQVPGGHDRLATARAELRAGRKTE
ncbi:MAG: tetratricopeptide repeat protein, partial [Gemmatimonadales bacterium]